VTDANVFPDLETLRRQEARLRPLVRALVHDDVVADVLQETWLRAWRRPPRSASSADGWLRRVAARFALTHRRAESRRRAHEAAAARDSATETPSTEETVERLSLQRAVAAAATSLPEPLRTAVLLRYYHGLSAEDTAARTGTTAANVRQRTRRGLAAMRSQLEGELGGGWRAAPAALWFCAPDPAGAPLTLVSSLLCMTKLGVASLVIGGLCVLAVVAATVPSWFATPPAMRTDEPVAARSEPSAPTSATGAGAVASVDAERTAVPGARGGESVHRVRGSVVDDRGRAVAGAEVRSAKADGTGWTSLAVSDAGGEVEIGPVSPVAQLDVAPPWIAVAVQMPSFDRPRVPPMFVVAAAREQVVTVRDDRGFPVAGATASVQVHGLVDFPRSLDDAARVVPANGVSDESGRVRWLRLPLSGTVIVLRKPGHRPVAVRVDEAAAADLEVVLVRIEKGERIVTGVVTGPRGSFLRSAVVGIGDRRTTTDDFGSYVLTIEPGAYVDPRAGLYAVADDLFPAVVRGFGARLEGADATVVQDLKVERLATVIEGRIVDADGKAVPGVAVYPWKLENLTENETAEDLAAPHDRPPLSLVGNKVRAFANTDDDGRFTLPGLDERPYRLRLFDRAQQWAWTTPEIRGGSRDVEVRLPADLQGPVAGIVRDRSGAPAARVRIGAYMEVHANGGGVASIGLRASTTTDAEGRFSLPALARHGVSLSLAGKQWVDQSHAIDPTVDTTRLEITVLRRCHVRVQLADPAFASAHVAFLDVNGDTVMIQQDSGGTSMKTTTCALHDGKTEVLSLSEAAVTLDVRKADGTSQQQYSIVLRPGDVNLVAR